jgi:hypothetical protein
MSPRLLSFLTEIETALGEIDPSPQGGAWEGNRMVNNCVGLARLFLSVRVGPDRLQPTGAIQIQSHRLADGSVCLKAYLSWTGSDAETVHAIYDRSQMDWRNEARRLASAWISGQSQSAAETPAGAYEPLAAAV